ncbi:MAG: threonine-phosphate decarboxylase CobD [Sedimenticola sp.]|nr:threonine-phosphate decarboxylase CobD [Sedimenticola sp.]
MLEHGGRLRAVAREQGIPLADWLDLSTGINPISWTPPSVPVSIWQRLPEDEDGLEEAASSYYGCGNLLPVPGSQSAIQALPQLRPRSVVGIINPIYQEHPQAWMNHGHEVLSFPVSQVDDYLRQLDVLVLCNPNNPDGRFITKTTLLGWANSLSEKGGWLIVDEAFMDTLPDAASVLDKAVYPGLIVLRSLGKFFGLAGARVGFVMAEETLLIRLKALIGPWSVAGPSRWIACQALADKSWQKEMKVTLARQAARLEQLLTRAGFSGHGNTGLFYYIESPDAEFIYRGFLKSAILVRHFPALGAIRFGLPGPEEDWTRFEKALNNLEIR